MAVDTEPDRKRLNLDPWLRYATALLASALLTLAFWRSRMEWTPDMRLWRAVGDAAFVLLAVALLLGPLAVLRPKAGRLLVWRRHLGVASAITAAIHAYLVWDGWALWSLDRLFGYQDLSEAGGPDRVLVDPGFGLANLVGIVALSWMLVIAATSSAWAMRRLGSRGWKYVQQFAYLVFYLAGLHSAYFLFMHYELGLVNLVFRKGVPDPNWARPYFVLLVGTVLVLQLAAFAKTVRRRKPEPPTGAEPS